MALTMQNSTNVAEVGAEGDAQQRVEDIVGQRGDDVLERRADDDADGQVHHVAFEGKGLELIEKLFHKGLLSVGGAGRRRQKHESGQAALQVA